MRISQTSNYIFAALALYGIVIAEPVPIDLGVESGNLIERQSGDDAGDSVGNAAGIGGQASQTQNTTATDGSTGGTGNGTTANSPGFISQPGDLDDDQVVCTNLTTGRANKCWNELKLTQWVINWANDNKCYESEGFSTCFLRLNGLWGIDCSQIAPNACVPPQNPNLATQPEVFYVAYNIYAINQFFYSWWTAVGNSGGIAADNIGTIAQIIDIPNNQGVILQDILLAVQSVFALIPGPLGIYAAHSAFSYTWQAAAQVISNALNTLPNIGRFLFPIDTSDSKIIQLADLSANFAQTVLVPVQSNLNQTLVSVMSNEAEFLAFASQGNFTALPPSLPDQSNYLYFAFNTYLISQALNGNNIYGVIARGTNPQAMDTNGTKLNYDIDCQEYNEQNVCDAWWYSGNYESAFTLNDFSHMNRNYGQQITNLFANLTTGELLFEGAQACNSEGNFGQPINITVNAAGVNTACISQLRILTWDMSCTLPKRGQINKKCEFLETTSQDMFLFQNAHAVTDESILSVPAGYLGPLITQTKQKLWRG
ncbi:hypothetical protein HO173_012866 [Letharia columbiana]|uniref:Uncharacterized protein n=1 Tax=Letharia columbiana TaxID=112416 RepID=A0A8H6CK49_9LECA|nr:uncharacterized protein HO173_012866 [Letharia columbiana]KAF6224709.1 hypothetical protein HO173_012866 [Letharia columbiana]